MDTEFEKLFEEWIEEGKKSPRKLTLKEQFFRIALRARGWGQSEGVMMAKKQAALAKVKETEVAK